MNTNEPNPSARVLSMRHCLESHHCSSSALHTNKFDSAHHTASEVPCDCQASSYRMCYYRMSRNRPSILTVAALQSSLSLSPSVGNVNYHHCSSMLSSHLTAPAPPGVPTQRLLPALACQRQMAHLSNHSNHPQVLGGISSRPGSLPGERV